MESVEPKHRKALTMKRYHVTMILAGLVLLMAADKNGEVRAKRFVLEDEKGRSRIVMGFTDGDPDLTLYDASETERLSVSLAGGEPTVYFADTKRIRLTLAIHDDAPIISLTDSYNNARMVYALDKTGDPVISLTSKDKNSSVTIGVAKDGHSFVETKGRSETRSMRAP
jgi:hypothetical protein